MDPATETPASAQLLPYIKPNCSEGMKEVKCFFSWGNKTCSKTPDNVGEHSHRMIVCGVSIQAVLVNRSDIQLTFQEDEKVDVQQIIGNKAVNGTQRLPAQCFKPLRLMLSDLVRSRFVRTEQTLDFLT